jgi:hypothetical protein
MKFDPANAMNIENLTNEAGIGEDEMAVFEENGEGVYCIRQGSRGYIEDITFVGTGPEFDYTDYEEAAEERFYEEHDEDEEFEAEFEHCEWEGMTFVCAENEEEADVYIYFAPSVKETFYATFA